MTGRALAGVGTLVVAWLAIAGCESEVGESSACSESSVTAASSRRCFARVLEVETNPQSPEYGRVACDFHVAFPAGSDACSCEAPGHAPPSRPLDDILARLSASGACDPPCCEKLCVCEFLQLSGGDLDACQNGSDNALGPVGWCYVSPEQGIGSEEVVAACPPGEKRLLRIVPVRHNVHGVLTCQTEVVVLPPDDAG